MQSKLMLGLLTAVLTISCGAVTAQEKPQQTTVCALLSNPGAWNHKLVEVTGLASHGFEDSGFSNPDCPQTDTWIWMMYGGKRQTGTMSTVNEYQRTRPTEAVVEGIKVPLVEDALFRRFDIFLHAGTRRIVRATVIGRFYSGTKTESADGKKTFWMGWGHLGCCSLLAIQQVLEVSDTPRPDLDQGEYTKSPDWKCQQYVSDASVYVQQREAESSSDGYAFTNPKRVARGALARYSNNATMTVFHEVSNTNSRAVFNATFADGVEYMVVVSKPYVLSYTAADPKKIAWVVESATRSCKY